MAAKLKLMIFYPVSFLVGIIVVTIWTLLSTLKSIVVNVRRAFSYYKAAHTTSILMIMRKK